MIVRSWDIIDGQWCYVVNYWGCPIDAAYSDSTWIVPNSWEDDADDQSND